VRKPEMPGIIKPQLATLKAKAPQGDQWIHEIKYDGYRIQLRIDKGKRRVFTRNGLDWTKRFSTIAETAPVLQPLKDRAERILKDLENRSTIKTRSRADRIARDFAAFAVEQDQTDCPSVAENQGQCACQRP
jgi:ATP-dependent DNA ligase